MSIFVLFCTDFTFVYICPFLYGLHFCLYSSYFVWTSLLSIFVLFCMDFTFVYCIFVLFFMDFTFVYFRPILNRLYFCLYSSYFVLPLLLSIFVLFCLYLSYFVWTLLLSIFVLFCMDFTFVYCIFVLFCMDFTFVYFRPILNNLYFCLFSSYFE